jgi:hypothetical protein
MSSSVPTPSFADDASDQSPKVPLVHRSSGSSARTHPTSDAAPSVLHLEYPHQQRSCFMVADEKVLRHNYDIPASISLHFLDKSTRMIDGHEDICVYKHMFLARVRLSFPSIVRELLSSLGITSGQSMPNGWTYFFSTFLLWPTVFPREIMSVPEFLNIYGPHAYPNSKTMTFMVCKKNQFIERRSTYSNNKYWVEQSFYISRAWEAADSKARPLRHSVPQE